MVLLLHDHEDFGLSYGDNLNIDHPCYEKCDLGFIWKDDFFGMMILHAWAPSAIVLYDELYRSCKNCMKENHII